MRSETSNGRPILRRIPMPVLIAVVPLTVIISFASGHHLVPPTARYAFYSVGGVAAGSWLLVHLRVRSALQRLALASVAPSATLALLAGLTPLPGMLSWAMLIAILPIGALGWFSFARHVEEQALDAGGWRLFLAGAPREESWWRRPEPNQEDIAAEP